MKILSFLLISIILTSCEYENNQSNRYIFNLSGKKLKKYLVSNHIVHSHTKIYNLKVYKIIYKTKDIHGKDINASGLLTIPTNYLPKNLNKSYNIVLDCHPTLFSNSKAPSVYGANNQKPTPSSIIFSAMKGFITIQPDYIGFGDSKSSYQPYLIKNVTSNSIKDFVNASVKFIKDINVSIENSSIYITGFSQGGYVALASSQELQKTYNIKSISTISGSYLLNELAQNKIKNLSSLNSIFLLKTLYAYNKKYNIDVNKFISIKYLYILSSLFNNNYSKKEIIKKLSNIRKLFLPNIEKNYNNSKLKKLLIKNSSINLKPNTNIELLYCKNDSIVPPFIAEETYEALLRDDTNVKLTSVENALHTYKKMNHYQCAYYGYFLVANMFEKLRDSLVP